MEVILKAPKGVTKWIKLYALYKTAFPAAEQKPFGMVIRMYRKGKTDIWSLEKGGKFMGLAITINGEDVILLDYFAVEKKQRGNGIGTAALQALQDHYKGKGFFLEIESTFEEAANKAQRQMRKRFYLSCGLQELHTRAKLFGVNMELLGVDCQMDYSKYKAFYRDNYNVWAAEHITPATDTLDSIT